MHRDLYDDLLAWKTSSTRKPLVLQGARQVGKTYLLQDLGARAFANCVYLNFEKNPELASFFNASLDPALIIENLSTYFEQQVKPSETLLIFDEIQECPRALNSLKYFCEDAPEYHIAAAGSLLGVKLANAAGFPVGKVNFLQLGPLTFFEFLTAIGKQQLRKHLESIEKPTTIAEPFHNDLLELFKKYLLVGGMPEAVTNFVNSKDLLKVRAAHEEILKAYDLDFAKHAPKHEIMRIIQIWQSIPKQLAKENNKFIFSVIRSGARGREYENALQWLVEAGLIIKSHNLTTHKLPLPAYGDTNAFKVFLLDVGLLSTMSKTPLNLLVPENLTLLSEFNGALTENYVAQALALQQRPLYYWTSQGMAEVDFILEHEGNIYPLEVKSDVSRQKKSLMVYAQKFAPQLLLRASARNFKLDAQVCNFPLYLISQYKKYLAVKN